MKLSELQTGEKGVIVKVMGRGAFRRRITEMGFIRGKEVQVIHNAPLKDPIQYRIMGYDLSLRRNDARLIEVVSAVETAEALSGGLHVSQQEFTYPQDELRSIAIDKGKTINVAFVGNPNSGKTSLFNFASGLHEHVGNYGGVTVDAKKAEFKQHGYTFKIVDLPGTYSLSSYTAEEIYVRDHLNNEHPDVVINVVDASNLERNLYLTCQLIDMDVRTVIALNMYDCLERHGDKFDYPSLAKMIGIPIVPTNGRTSEGLEELFNHVIQVYEETDPVLRHIHINYGETLENSIRNIRDMLRANGYIEDSQSKRHLAIKLLERDKETGQYIGQVPSYEIILKERDRNVLKLEELLHTDSETAFIDARYGFISGALRETYESNKIKEISNTQIIDTFITHKVLGFPIFLLFMWIMFESTFRLGQYPMNWIEELVGIVGNLVQNHLSEGPLKDLLTDGIIRGVGGVIVFLPNILILYAFISLMEDSGYMARAAFIMDKLMHKMGLHGKSFISLIMGFGCNVPAILASRTIESRNSRMLTMLVNPLMSCSARLPVYLLLAGAFFPGQAGLILFALYATGILLAIVMARLFKRFFFNKEDIPFVMELPPYRMPTGRSILIHMWDKANQYLRKMGGVILAASIIIWFLGYFPRQEEQGKRYEQQIETVVQFVLSPQEKELQINELNHLRTIEHQQNSYIGRLGQTIQPLLRPLGFDWKISISLLTGMAAKEVVVSTLSVLYTGEDTDNTQLAVRLKQDTDAEGNPAFTPLVSLSLMFFVLIYFPCIATVTAIVKESHSWKWGAFVIVYTCMLAWIVSFAVYQIGNLFT
ncbi:MAG: ferrous iron transport protein B [Prevotellaceae bacterium]|jgi:ferrous iron transport protein B|nr:ferrous iron transport protein B [Prevotellaceae bacterium]